MKNNPFCFVLMPFNDKFDDYYHIGIKETCKKLDIYCERVDEQYFEGSIIDRIYNQISKADIIISDLTDRSPNVFYETGYAHALQKRVILLTQKIEDIPFDLSHYPHIVYAGKTRELIIQLEKRLKWYLKNPDKSLKKSEIEIQFFMNGHELDSSEIEIPKQYKLCRNFLTIKKENDEELFGINIKLKIDIFNNTQFLVEKNRFKLAIVTTNKFEGVKGISKTIAIPENHKMHLLPQVDEIYPSCWDSLEFEFTYWFKDFEGFINVHEFVLRKFTEFGSYDIPFKIFLKK